MTEGLKLCVNRKEPWTCGEAMFCQSCMDAALLQKDALFRRIVEARAMIERGPDEGKTYLDLSGKVFDFLKTGTRQWVGPSDVDPMERTMPVTEKREHHCMATMALQAAEEQRDAANRQVEATRKIVEWAVSWQDHAYGGYELEGLRAAVQEYLSGNPEKRDGPVLKFGDQVVGPEDTIRMTNVTKCAHGIEVGDGPCGLCNS